MADVATESLDHNPDLNLALRDLSVPVAREIETKVENDESAEGEDYSSGSDRSLDLDAEDNDIYRDAESGQQESLVAGRRKKRHGSHGSRRHKGGSRHKNRGFHPYLDPQEQMQLKRKSQELKEKENAAAVVRQEGESRFMNFPVAPFNSTQFLMDEHDSGSPASLPRTCSSSKLSEESSLIHSVASTPADAQHESQERKDKEFTDIYATVHAESLQSLPKDELVKNYMSLEEKVAALQKKVAEAEQLKRQNDDSGESHTRLGAPAIEVMGPLMCVVNGLTSNDSNHGVTLLPQSSRPTISVGDTEDLSALAQATSPPDSNNVILS